MTSRCDSLLQNGTLTAKDLSCSLVAAVLYLPIVGMATSAALVQSRTRNEQQNECDISVACGNKKDTVHNTCKQRLDTASEQFPSNACNMTVPKRPRAE